MPTYTCRRATVDDAAEMAALRAAQVNSPLTCALTAETEELTALQVKDPRCLPLVIWEGQKLVGYALFHLMVAPADEAVARVWVLDFAKPQTQLKVIAKMLLLEACNYLELAGVKRVNSQAWADRPAVDAFVSGLIPATSEVGGKLRSWTFDVAKVKAACQK